MEQSQEAEPIQSGPKPSVQESERGDFAAKVFGIICTQLTVTAALCIFGLTETGGDFFAAHLWIGFFMLVLAFAAVLILIYSPQFSHSVPTNYVLLFTFTLGISYVLALICSLYSSGSLLFAIILTAIMTGSLCAYGMQARAGYSEWRGYMMVLSYGFIGYLVGAIFVGGAVISSFWASLVAILFGAYLVKDVQMIMKNDDGYYDVDDYILAAMNVYLDIINVFVSLYYQIVQQR
eukprot:TRINITY_DN2076_c0_g1_i4.p3 TRINITY_DN2076_c0_g1~~TRINITY_DN2076_c0_g1_i4.p3  ORF type:complete len:235 (+),score=57.58 TRINITY_DN2076_c0_g1_i4:141-845(+)